MNPGTILLLVKQHTLDSFPLDTVQAFLISWIIVLRCVVSTLMVRDENAFSFAQLEIWFSEKGIELRVRPGPLCVERVGVKLLY